MKIAIIGTGRMGSWLLKAMGSFGEARGYDRGFSPSEILSFSPDILVNAVSLDRTIEVFKAIEPHLPAETVIADIASVKGELKDYYKSLKRNFVSTHPMFGPTWANTGELAGQNVIIITESSPKATVFWEDFYRSLGTRIWYEDFSGHDDTIAWSLAIPFASTMAFASCMKKPDSPGTTFKKHLEIAEGLLQEDNSLLAEVLLNPHAARSLELIGSRLNLLTHMIRDGDREAMLDFFAGLRGKLGIGTAAI